MKWALCKITNVPISINIYERRVRKLLLNVNSAETYLFPGEIEKSRFIKNTAVNWPSDLKREHHEKIWKRNNIDIYNDDYPVIITLPDLCHKHALL